MRELIVGGLCDLEQIFPCFGRRVATCVSLEKLGSQTPLKSVYVPDNSGMMHAKNLGCAGNGAHSGDVISGANFVPRVN